MTVSDFIQYLQKQQQDLEVVYRAYSEQSILYEHDIEVKELCKPRPDGWVQDFRSDKESQKYLVLPGN